MFFAAVRGRGPKHIAPDNEVCRRLLVLIVVVAAAGALTAAAPARGRSPANRPVSLVGTLEIGHFDGVRAGHPLHFAILSTRTGGVNLRFAAQPPAQLSGSRVALRGIRTGNALRVTALHVLGPSRADFSIHALRATATTDLSVAVLLFNFSNNTAQPWSADTVRGAIFTNADSTSAYYQEVTYGKVNLVGDVLGWFTLPSNNSTCDFTTWASQAKAAATNSGVDLTRYQRFMLVFPATLSCDWAGLGTGVDAWLNGTIALRFSAHELGHTFGLGHSRSMSCTEGGQRVAISSDLTACTVNEYGDPFDVLGSATTHDLSNYDRASAGWLDPSGVQTVTTSGTYTLAPVESADASTPRLLKIRRADSSWLDLEFRQPYGQYFDNFLPDDPVVNGVTIRWTAPTGGPSQLIDATPATSSYDDSPLAVGQTLTDSGGGLSISTVSTSVFGAVVAVTFPGGGTSDTEAPTAPAGLTVTAADATTAVLSWGASTDNVAVTGYRIYRDGLPVATTDALTRSWGDGGRTPGTTYLYAVSAFDAAANSGATATGAIAMPAAPPAADVTPPTAPTGLKTTLAKGRKVALSWSAATDNTGVVAYRVLRNGAVVASVNTTSFTDSLPAKISTATYVVVAVDAAGNVSPPSNTASV